jgi:hypothetical protein
LPNREEPNGLVRLSPRPLADRSIELACATRDVPYTLAILDQSRSLSAAYAFGFPDEDREEMNERLATVERAGAGLSATESPTAL